MPGVGRECVDVDVLHIEGQRCGLERFSLAAFRAGHPRAAGIAGAVDEHLRFEGITLAAREDLHAADRAALHPYGGKLGIDHGVDVRLAEHFVDHDASP